MPDSEKTGAKAGENKAIKELKKNCILRKPTMPVSWIPFKQIQTESRNADSNFSLIEKLLKPWS